MLLLSAQEDDWHGDDMAELHRLLSEAGWPHEYRVSDWGHSLTASDIEAALGFFIAHGAFPSLAR